MNTATIARDEGIARVESNNVAWGLEARARLRFILSEPWTGIGEELRLMLTGGGLPQPRHPNCWGALIKWCVSEGLLIPTGETRNTRDMPSHACYTKVYRSWPSAFRV